MAQVRSLLTAKQTETRTLERRVDDLEAEARRAARQNRRRCAWPACRQQAAQRSVCGLTAARLRRPQLAHARAESRRVAAECERLSTEKAALVETVKSLSKEVTKLDAFKRNVLKTLNDEAVETVDHAAEPRSQAQLHAYSPATGTRRRACLPRLPPAAWRCACAAASRAATHSPAAAAHAELPSAVKTFQAMHAAPAYGHAEQAPPPSSVGVPDGKAFFRTARARLPPDSFAAFLASIKALNSHTRTRAQTLDDAAALFGPENHDLLASFEQLLQAHLA